LFFPRPTKVEGCSRRVSSVGSGPNDSTKNIRCGIHRRLERNTEYLHFLPGQIYFANPKESLNGFIKVRALREFFREDNIALRGLEQLVGLFLQLRHPV